MSNSYKVHNPVINEDGTPFWTSVVRVLLLTSGTPVFMMPLTFISAGYITGSLLLVVVVCLYLHNMHMILWSAQQISTLKCETHILYSDLLHKALTLQQAWVGPWLGSCIRILCTFILSLTWYSICIFVYLLLARTLQTACITWSSCDITLHQTLLLLILPVLVVCLVSKSKYLESLAIFGFICNLISLLMVLYYVLMDPSPWILGYANGLLGKPLYTGILLLNLSVTPVILLFKSETKNRPTRKFDSFTSVLNVSYVLILVIYFMYLLTCGLKYGNSVPENTIILIPSEHILSAISLLFYGIGLLCVYPHLYCGLLDLISNDIFEEKLKYKNGLLKIWTYSFKILGVLLSCLVTYFRPNLLLFLSLAGTVCTSIDSIVYPAIVHTIVKWKVGKSKLIFALIFIKNLLILAIGLYLVVMGIEDCVRLILNNDE